MLNLISESINLVDAALFCVFVWIICAGIRQGLLVECFKFLGAFLATPISLHYFGTLAKILSRIIAVPKAVNETLAFFLLWLIVAVVFKLSLEGFLLFKGKKEQKAGQTAVFAVGVAILRAILVCGLLFISLFLVGNKALVKTASESKVAWVCGKVSVGIYQGIYKGIIKNIFPEEEFNARVLALYPAVKI